MLEMKKLKYLTILLLPITVAVSFTNEGWLVHLPVIVFFVLIPILELLFPSDNKNLEEKEKLLAEKDPFYNLLLYLMVPLQVAYLFWFLKLESIATSDSVGRALSMGIMCGVIGINVGHELGHRLNRFEQFLGEILLLTSLENHFLPYHNRGHHTNVGTPSDPATARRNEPLYFFWIRSHFGSYFQAWKIEIQRMRIMKKFIFSFSNRMVCYNLTQLLLCVSIYYFFGSHVLIQFLIVAGIGILLLETVNYIEHYGLMRKQRENGTYESVKRMHSWNANNVFGRVVLFELTRHSDHHFKADRPYQLLESHEESPIMPTGYPGMMLLSFIPPLFFRVMNKRIVA
jgi:alkane 1-monooxygenase